MRHNRRRRQHAATIYAGLGLFITAMAIFTASGVLLLVAMLCFVMVPVAFVGYPVDRDW